MAFPATLAQDVLQRGFDHPPLRDEIYVQVVTDVVQAVQPPLRGQEEAQADVCVVWRPKVTSVLE
jgi:hypothetical protein